MSAGLRLPRSQRRRVHLWGWGQANETQRSHTYLLGQSTSASVPVEGLPGALKLQACKLPSLQVAFFASCFLGTSESCFKCRLRSSKTAITGKLDFEWTYVQTYVCIYIYICIQTAADIHPSSKSTQQPRSQVRVKTPRGSSGERGSSSSSGLRPSALLALPFVGRVVKGCVWRGWLVLQELEPGGHVLGW